MTLQLLELENLPLACSFSPLGCCALGLGMPAGQTTVSLGWEVSQFLLLAGRVDLDAEGVMVPASMRTGTCPLSGLPPLALRPTLCWYCCEWDKSDRLELFWETIWHSNVPRGMVCTHCIFH